MIRTDQEYKFLKRKGIIMMEFNRTEPTGRGLGMGRGYRGGGMGRQCRFRGGWQGNNRNRGFRFMEQTEQSEANAQRRNYGMCNFRMRLNQ
ncbi:MAG: hypothetical protein ACOX0M_07405 [Salinivirgaceae bacterium]|jgi:hypothetical protein|nr:hypothetical protein [Bacteroidales bacterium]